MMKYLTYTHSTPEPIEALCIIIASPKTLTKICARGRYDRYTSLSFNCKHENIHYPFKWKHFKRTQIKRPTLAYFLIQLFRNHNIWTSKKSSCGQANILFKRNCGWSANILLRNQLYKKWKTYRYLIHI